MSLRRSRRRISRRRSAWPRNTLGSKKDLKERLPRKESGSRKKTGESNRKMKELSASENKKKISGLRKKLATNRNVRRKSERLLCVRLKISRSLLTSLVTQEVLEEAVRSMEFNQHS